MKRNRGGEQDLDHIIAAAVRGMDRAILEYPQVRAGLIFCLDRGLQPRAERDHRRQGDQLAQPRRGRRSTSPARWSRASASRTTRDVFDECRRAGLGITVHAGETGGADGGARGGRGARADAHRPWHPQRRATRGCMGMLRERGIVLEVCPSSNLSTGVVRSVAELRRILRALIDHEVRVHAVDRRPGDAALATSATSSTLLLRRGMLTLDEVERAIETASRRASSTARRPIETSARPRRWPRPGRRADRPRGRGLGS